jgi:hypothetical protein
MTTTDGDTFDIQDVQAIVRDLHFKRLAGTLQPIDESVRRILTGFLRRGIESGEASPEERAFAEELGVIPQDEAQHPGGRAR